MDPAPYLRTRSSSKDDLLQFDSSLKHISNATSATFLAQVVLELKVVDYLQ